jgi:hypothetical protein
MVSVTDPYGRNLDFPDRDISKFSIFILWLPEKCKMFT